MKQFVFIIAILFSFLSIYAQDTAGLFKDNNPKLTAVESQWLNSNLNIDGYNFAGKYIGFFEMTSGGFYGIGKDVWTLHKKNLKQLDLNKYNYELVRLDSTQKRASRGYDALLVFANKRISGKLSRLNKEKLIAQAMNRYPQIPIDAGIDTNEKLNDANAIFFNEIYKADLYPKTDFDFRGKKVVIIDSDCGTKSLKKVTVKEYVDYIKTQLDLRGYSMTEDTHYLSTEQKDKSGGYDVIISYRCKKGLPLAYLIEFLQINPE